MTYSLTLEKEPKVFPEMIVFDLDFTLWAAWIDCSYGPPFKYDTEKNEVIDSYNSSIKLFRYTTSIIALIKSYPNIKIGIASRTEAPDWAITALKMLRIPELNNTTMFENLDYLEIYPGSKLTHFKRLSEKTGIDCSHMIFFDDEERNKEVTKLGVQFVKVDTRRGITPEQFENVLHIYAKSFEV